MKLIKKIFPVDEYLTGISTVSQEEAKRQQEALKAHVSNKRKQEDEVKAFFSEKVKGYRAKLKS